MFRARQGKGIVVRTANKIGALAEFSKIAAERGVSILAISAWVEDAEAVIRLICDDTPRTMGVLRTNQASFASLRKRLPERTSISFTSSPVRSIRMNV